MDSTVNHLVQLQELTLVRAEQKAAGKDTDLAQLDASIGILTLQLADDIRLTIGKLQKRDPMFIVPMTNSVCAGCGMHLPTSLVQIVRQGHTVSSCPTCTRILFHPEASYRNEQRAPSRVGPRKIGIQRFSDVSLMIPNLEAVERDEAIREMAVRLHEKGFVDRAERLAEDAIRRENIVSTAVEHGIAFPHVRCVEGGGLTLALGMSRKGIKFGSPRKLTRVLFFMVIPTAASAFYLKLLAGLTTTFISDEAREKLMAETTPESMWKTLCKLTRPTIQ
jgi:mannitol/fructose-specific phosphotransferase system IIA component (Ntr-type)